MDIRGVLIAIGGNEDKGTRNFKTMHVLETDLDFATSGILCRILAELKSEESSVEIITSASTIPQKVGQKYLRAFKKLGQKNVHVLHITSKEEADTPEMLEIISNTACIMFTGGDQFKLISILKDSAFAKIVNRRYLTDDIVIAGTSAGSMAMPDLMIYPGSEPMNVTQKKVPVYEALSIIHNIIIDTHFLVRGRFRRLAVAVANNPEHLGIGLEEDTGIIVRKGNEIEAIGSGLVTILDGTEIRDHNSVTENHKIFIENLVVHVLCNGDHFELNRKIT